MSEELMSIAEIRERLITTDKGAVKQCIRNVVTVLQNDPKFKGVIRYNMMTDRNDIPNALLHSSFVCCDQSFPDFCDTH